MRILRLKKADPSLEFFDVETNFVNRTADMAQMFENKIVVRFAHSVSLCHIPVSHK